MDLDKETQEKEFHALFCLGKNFFSQGKYKKAEIIFSGLMALYPDHPDPFIAFGDVLLMRGQPTRALDHFLITNKQFDLESRALLGACKACILLGKHEEAKKLLSPIIYGEITASSSDVQAALSMMRAINANGN